MAANEVGLTPEEMQAGLEVFKSVRRRLEVRGEVGGVTVYDDFAHHPTAVAETLRGLRAQFPEARIWAVFEPRSQTARRRIFEDRFARALREADIAIVAPPFSTAHLESENVIRPRAMVEAIESTGGAAHSFGTTGEIVDFVTRNALAGDRLVVMSNGGFDNIHQRLLDALKGR